uniref:hypothetical protein n=1 Tax=Alloprevotella sp. TaxID=1872471 RepID=UPI004029CA32
SPPHFASKVSYSAAPQTFAECSRSASCCCAASALLFGSKPRRDFFWILNTPSSQPRPLAVSCRSTLGRRPFLVPENSESPRVILSPLLKMGARFRQLKKNVYICTFNKVNPLEKQNQ